jgi:hypothetical protein
LYRPRREHWPLAPNSSGALAVTVIVADIAGEARSVHSIMARRPRLCAASVPLACRRDGGGTLGSPRWKTHRTAGKLLSPFDRLRVTFFPASGEGKASHGAKSGENMVFTGGRCELDTTPRS